MTYQALAEKAGERRIVRVVTPNKNSKTTTEKPRFKIMSDVDLEVGAFLSVNYSFNRRIYNRETILSNFILISYLFNIFI